MSGTVIFLGAGATRSCGGPITKEILPLRPWVLRQRVRRPWSILLPAKGQEDLTILATVHPCLGTRAGSHAHVLQCC
jgi:hypothetical protein